MPSLTLPDLNLNYHILGNGFPLILLHGWPEWSAIWRRLTPALTDRFKIIIPDLRNFGESVGTEARDVEHYINDLEGLVNHLKLRHFGLVGHDIGAFLAQDYTRRHPESVVGLFVFDCPHFGLGRRWVEGGHLGEIWYQSFHQLPIAETLVGASRVSCRTYLEYFLRHWACRNDAFEDVLDEWTDNFMKPGRLSGGFRWYAVAHARRVATIADPSHYLNMPITVPAYSLWGKWDPILLVNWQQTLTDVFDKVEMHVAKEAGHFVPWECPNLSAKHIIHFFNNQNQEALK